MSVFVAFNDKGKIFIGSDGRIVEGETIVSNCTKKWITIENYTIAICGLFRASQILPKKLKIRKNDDLITVATKIREIVKKDTEKSHVESNELIIIKDKQIYECGNDYTPCVSGLNYSVIGSGADFAKGVLYAATNLEEYYNKKSSVIVEMAIRCAISFNNNCGGNIFVEEVE